MRTKLACVVAAVLAERVAGSPRTPPPRRGRTRSRVGPARHGTGLARSHAARRLSLVHDAFSAELSVVSPSTLGVVNLWLDGWSGNRRCLSSQHDSPADGFTLAGGVPTTVGFHQATIECTPPFSIDRIDARVRSGEEIVYRGSWTVSLSFVE